MYFSLVCQGVLGRHHHDNTNTVQETVNLKKNYAFHSTNQRRKLHEIIFLPTYKLYTGIYVQMSSLLTGVDWSHSSCRVFILTSCSLRNFPVEYNRLLAAVIAASTISAIQVALTEQLHV